MRSNLDHVVGQFYSVTVIGTWLVSLNLMLTYCNDECSAADLTLRNQILWGKN
jgi:hypothetical protein